MRMDDPGTLLIKGLICNVINCLYGQYITVLKEKDATIENTNDDKPHISDIKYYIMYSDII